MSVTVGIPFYKKSNCRYLKQAIDSIINQTIKIDEIHLIQDGEVNLEISNLIKNYKDKHSNIIHFILDKSGLPKALNHSIKKTNSEFYARMDADDISIENRIESQLKYLNRNEHVDILGTWAFEFIEDTSTNNFIIKKPNDINKLYELFHYKSPLIHPSVMFRKSVFEKIGFYNESFFTQQDLELWGRAIKANVVIDNLMDPLIFYRNVGVLNRRSSYNEIILQIKARYSFNTYSIRLNILKLTAILFRLLPFKFRKWGYKNLR